jgi:TrmH family RNA methyltransferase
MDNKPAKEPSLIQSRQNPKVKFLAGLRKKRNRDQHGCFLIEGRKELESFLATQWQLEELFYCPEFIKAEDESLLAQAIEKRVGIFELSAHAFEKCSIRENPDGWLGLAKNWQATLSEIRLSGIPLLLILEGTEKPGNLGAILRTANACGVDAVICNDPLVDLFNPNVIRASRGLVFSTQVVIAESKETSEFLKQNNIQAAATICGDGKPIWSQNLSGPLAVVMGNEAIGLSEYWQKQAGVKIFIPTPGLADSLNLSTATAICLYEVLRQRRVP